MPFTQQQSRAQKSYARQSRFGAPRTSRFGGSRNFGASRNFGGSRFRAPRQSQHQHERQKNWAIYHQQAPQAPPNLELEADASLEEFRQKEMGMPFATRPGQTLQGWEIEKGRQQQELLPLSHWWNVRNAQQTAGSREAWMTGSKLQGMDAFKQRKTGYGGMPENWWQEQQQDQQGYAPQQPQQQGGTQALPNIGGGASDSGASQAAPQVGFGSSSTGRGRTFGGGRKRTFGGGGRVSRFSNRGRGFS